MLARDTNKLRERERGERRKEGRGRERRPHVLVFFGLAEP